MYIVGIDIAKRKHEAAVIDGEGAVIIKPFSFTNNCSGYNRLLAMLTKAKLPLDEVSFAMEATGHYWLALFTRLQKEGSRGETWAVSDGGAITTLGAFHTFRKPCVAGT